MNKVLINPNYIRAFLSPIDLCSNMYQDDCVLDYIENEQDLKTMFEVLLKPEYSVFDDSSQQTLKENLKYFLNQKTNYLSEVLEDLQYPFGDFYYVEFFRLLWEVLFNGDDCSLSEAQKYKVKVKEIKGRAFSYKSKEMVSLQDRTKQLYKLLIISH